jgi:hypothetical protein
MKITGHTRATRRPIVSPSGHMSLRPQEVRQEKRMVFWDKACIERLGPGSDWVHDNLMSK